MTFNVAVVFIAYNDAELASAARRYASQAGLSHWQICERLAREYRVETSDTAELTGYKGREARNSLATRFAVMPGESEADSAVERACADRLSVPEV